MTLTVEPREDEQLDEVTVLDETLTPAQRWLFVLLVALAALNAGYQFAIGGSLYIAMAPIALIAGLAVGVLALVNFEAFILLLLFSRALLDFSRGKVERSIGAAGTSGPWAAAASAVLVIAGILWLAGPRLRARRSTAEWAMAAFVAAGTLSVLASEKPDRTLLEVARVTAAVVMFAVVRRLVAGAPRVADRVLTAVFASAIIPLLVAGYQMVFGSGGFQAGGFSRVRGTFVHPNPFAFYLTLLITMGVALFPHLRGWRQLALGAIVAASTGALLATYTRTGWLALFVALLVVGILQTRWLIAVLVCAVVLMISLVPSVGDRFSDLGEARTQSGAAGNSLIWRVEYWKQAVDLADRSPVLGIGLKMTASQTDEAKAPHNDVIRAYAETGIVGLAAYLTMVGAIIAIAVRGLRVAAAGRERGIAVGFAGCVVAFVLFSLVSNVASQVALLWYFFAFAAVATAIGSAPSPAPRR